MAKIGNITIVNKSEAFNSGAAFLMQRPSPITSVIKIDSNSIVEIEKDNPYVVVRTQDLDSHQNAFDYGHELVQKGLDILSITGKYDLSTRNSANENFVWWFSNNKVTLRITDITSLNWGINLNCGENSNSFENNGFISVASASIYPSYRYFRLSQITDDLFDAYRNMYLAFELLVSSNTQKMSNESEPNWLKRYLQTINSDILTTTFVGSSDPIQEFIDEIYKTTRCCLFHAKNGASFFNPHGEIQNRQTVAKALSKLTRIFLLLTKETNQSVRGVGDSMSTGLERQVLIAPYLDKGFFILSDDDSPFEPDEIGFDNPRYKSAIKSEKITENSTYTHKFSLIGNIPNIKSEDISQIRRVELSDENGVAKCTMILEVPIWINEVDNLEIQFNFQTISSSSPKKQYD
ncbi:hypothetical protein BCS42_06270 [Crenothrix sp. D3]|nr:hypothetical protein BCS42_06270 [Crenothrix sp. D3]